MSRDKKYPKPMLPWIVLPRWLRVLRVLLVVSWCVTMAALVTAFVLQFQVLDSPTHAAGVQSHAVEFKGGTFYLDVASYAAWVSLTRAIPVLLFYRWRLSS
jgi:hypothetical protein